jgi:hypothetical protein
MSTCTLEGDPDMYGLGIRVGFYLQWVAQGLASSRAQEELSNIAYANNLFVFALITSLIVKTGSDSVDFITSEAYIVLLFTYARFEPKVSLEAIVNIYKIIRDGWTPWQSRGEEGETGSVVGDALAYPIHFAVNAYRIWFWTSESNIPGQRCEEFGFLLAKVKLRAIWFRSFQVTSAAVLLAYLVYGLLKLVYLVLREQKTLRRSLGYVILAFALLATHSSTILF